MFQKVALLGALSSFTPLLPIFSYAALTLKPMKTNIEGKSIAATIRCENEVEELNLEVILVITSSLHRSQ